MIISQKYEIQLPPKRGANICLASGSTKVPVNRDRYDSIDTHHVGVNVIASNSLAAPR